MKSIVTYLHHMEEFIQALLANSDLLASFLSFNYSRSYYFSFYLNIFGYEISPIPTTYSSTKV